MICGYCSETVEGAPALCPACNQAPLLDARYRLDSIVGRGAMGVTYRAERLSDGQVVAIKELPFRRIDAVKTKAMFEREARVLEQLDHPGVPAYLDDFLGGVGKNLSLYLVQTFVDGQTLKAEMTARRWREDEVLALIAEVADILTYLHELSPPVIHRDIKPGNLMRRADGSLALIDFGAVRDALDDEHTGGSTVVGTYGFMAPEQFRGDASPASDLYALGATAVALLSRKMPDTMVDVGGRLDWAPHVDVHPETRALLDDLLQVDPARRSQRARAVARRCRAAIEAIEAARSAPAAPRARPITLPEAPEFALAPAMVTELPQAVDAPISAAQDAVDLSPAPASNARVGLVAGIALFVSVVIAIMALMATSPERAKRTSSADARCGATPCPPVARGLKGLEFGMTRAEANAALPALADGRTTQKRFSGGYMDFGALGDGPSLGEVVTVETTLGSLPASCAVEFLDAGKLTRMACTLEGQQNQASHRAAQDALAAALEQRYGPPTNVWSGSGNTMINKIDRTWTWEDDGATLTLKSSYSDLGGMMGAGHNRLLGVDSTIVLTNEGPTHDRIMAEARNAHEVRQAAKRAQADREAAESARRAREALDNGKLGEDL